MNAIERQEYEQALKDNRLQIMDKVGMWYDYKGTSLKESDIYRIKPLSVGLLKDTDKSSGIYDVIPYSFDEKVDLELGHIGGLLKSKNKKYGNSALEPIRVFSKADNLAQLCVRIDDKLSRIQKGIGDDEDTISDLIGYLILLKIAKKEAEIERG